MTDAEAQRKIFWELFEEILIENGEPFKISYKDQNGEIKHYAAVNKYYTNTPSGTAIDLSFLQQKNKRLFLQEKNKGLFRVNFYVYNKNIINKLLANKEDVNSMVTTNPIEWERGEKN